ncbi:hypothetical protein COB64_00095 [Candidatus Wolfebacteria bacterium]|nr:MAG: hypothetical protein COB64_00095 [Candidatus Wolfebacteria bacterium]
MGNQQEQDINIEIINLVIARLRTIPKDASLSVGENEHEANLNSEALITEVKNQTEIGKKFIESELFFLRTLKDLPI